uniref:Uncharacterized protein n=1 Tax=Salarias fasciatus TaxID=181472 RepID=A0A672JMS7_SALFA
PPDQQKHYLSHSQHAHMVFLHLAGKSEPSPSYVHLKSLGSVCAGKLTNIDCCSLKHNKKDQQCKVKKKKKNQQVKINMSKYVQIFP